MPVFEEDEESDDWPGGEEGEPAEEAQAETNTHSLQVENALLRVKQGWPRRKTSYNHP